MSKGQGGLSKGYNKMKNKPSWMLPKERLIITIGIVASIIAGFALNTVSKNTHNALFAWLGTAAFCVAIVLAIIVLPMVMRKHEKAGDNEPDRRRW